MPSPSFAEMRRRNAAKILSAVREQPHVSRADVARATKLARATVSSIVDELIALDILQETGSRAAAKGRRPIGLTFNTAARLTAGVSVEGDKIDFVICGLDGNVLGESTVQRSAEAQGERLVQLISGSVLQIMQQCALSSSKLGAVGLAVPGPLCDDRRDVHGNDYSTVCQGLKLIFGKEIVLDSNVNMYALAQTRREPFNRSRSIFIVRAGHLVRSAFFVNGALFEGSDRRAGEFGHMKIGGAAQQCQCGATGCINAIASNLAIVTACRQHHPSVDTLEQVSLYASSGDLFCRQVLRQAGLAIGFGIAAVLNVLAPERVLVSGRHLVEHEFVQSEIMAAAQANSFPGNFAGCIISIAAAEQRVEAIGAAMQAIPKNDLLSSLESLKT